jgi:PAS domain S-box-containing protein
VEKWLVQLTFHDISERRQAQEALRRSEQTYRAIFENTGTANLIVEEDGIISLANAEFVKMTGYARADIEGKMRWGDFVLHREDASSHGQLRLVPRHAIEDRIREDRVERFRATIMGQKDFKVDVVVTIASIPDSTQKVYGLADISQLAYTEQVLKQSEERHRALVEQSSEGIATIDLRNRRIVEANETFLNILGYDHEDIRMFTIYDLLMENKGYIDNAIGRVIRKGRYFMGEQTLRGKNGSTAEVDMAAALVRYGDAMHVMISTRDISEKKQMEETLRQAQKMEALGTLAGGIAHDLNNILQVVTGFAYQLKAKTQQDPAAAKCVSEILGASQRGSNLTKSILTFSRKQPVYLQRLDVNDVLKGTERFLKRLVKENIEFRVQCPSHEVTVMVDRIQVEQILMNLVANANDAMPLGGTLLLQTTVETLSEGFVKSYGFGKPGAYARISVADTGVGMDEETKGRIFEPFFSTKDTSKNTGLGMSVVYGIVKQHNGYITVESRPGMGTTIDVYLPLVAVGEIAKSQADEPAAVTADTMPAAGSAQTILVAEDQPGVRAFLKGLLEEAGYTVLEAEDGEKAVELFRTHKDSIDLLVLDIIMPAKDGKRAYDEMRAMRDDIKAIFLSGYSDEITSDYGIRDGGFVLVSKPVLPPILLEKIRELLESGHSHPAG